MVLKLLMWDLVSRCGSHWGHQWIIVRIRVSKRTWGVHLSHFGSFYICFLLAEEIDIVRRLTRDFSIGTNALGFAFMIWAFLRFRAIVL